MPVVAGGGKNRCFNSCSTSSSRDLWWKAPCPPGERVAVTAIATAGTSVNHSLTRRSSLFQLTCHKMACRASALHDTSVPRIVLPRAQCVQTAASSHCDTGHVCAGLEFVACVQGRAGGGYCARGKPGGRLLRVACPQVVFF